MYSVQVATFAGSNAPRRWTDFAHIIGPLANAVGHRERCEGLYPRETFRIVARSKGMAV